MAVTIFIKKHYLVSAPCSGNFCKILKILAENPGIEFLVLMFQDKEQRVSRQKLQFLIFKTVFLHQFVHRFQHFFSQFRNFADIFILAVIENIVFKRKGIAILKSDVVLLHFLQQHQIRHGFQQMMFGKRQILQRFQQLFFIFFLAHRIKFNFIVQR